MKRFAVILATAVLIGLAYYLFVRQHEFEVTLRANTLPGDLIQTIRIWNRSLDKSEIVRVDSLNALTQSIVWNNRSYVYDWRFNVVNDSLTKVNVRVSEPGRGFWNKILIPFTSQPIEQDASEIMYKFRDILKEHLEITRVKLIGETELDSSFCLCSSLETRQIEKANGMMKDYPALTGFISQLGLEVKGPPAVRVREWNHNEGFLKFDFCFSIVKTDSLPSPWIFSYKSFPRQRVLKAEHYGNYITSDRAWYALVNYAHDKGYKLRGLPIELFHNNPNLGANQSSWKADIYLPIE